MCAAALAAARLRRRVVLTEETHWLGCQLTNQAVPPDERPWIEEFERPRPIAPCVKGCAIIIGMIFREAPRLAR